MVGPLNSHLGQEAVITGSASLPRRQSGRLSFLSKPRYADNRRTHCFRVVAFVPATPAWNRLPASVIGPARLRPFPASSKRSSRSTVCPLDQVRRGVHPSAVIEGMAWRQDLWRTSSLAPIVRCWKPAACLEGPGGKFGRAVHKIGKGGVRIGRGARLFPMVTVLELVNRRKCILHFRRGDSVPMASVTNSFRPTSQIHGQAGIVQIDKRCGRRLGGRQHTVGPRRLGRQRGIR